MWKVHIFQKMAFFPSVLSQTGSTSLDKTKKYALESYHELREVVTEGDFNFYFNLSFYDCKKTGWWESLLPLSLVLFPYVTSQEEITEKEWVVQTCLSMEVSVARIIFSLKDLKCFILSARLDKCYDVVTQKQLKFFKLIYFSCVCIWSGFAFHKYSCK